MTLVCARPTSGNTVATKRHEIYSGQTLVDGDWVVLNSDGTISKAGATSANLYGRFKVDYTDSNYGIVELGLADVEFCVKCDASIDATMIGQLFDINADGTLDVAGSTYDVLQMRELQGDANFTSRFAWVIINPLKSQANGVAA